MSPLEERLRRRIAADGPITVAEFMGEANAHYYGTRDPLGAEGDFTTAPEISQMFGELVGIWLADLWERAGRPEAVRYVELGPGRGTLAMDALRAMGAAGLAPPVELVETSPVLRHAQAERVRACWHDSVATLPTDGPLLVVANEFFDALPIEQFDAGGGELNVVLEGESFVRPGEVASERSPVSLAITRDLARRIAAQGGAVLIVDYGYVGPSQADTLQSLWRHASADPFAEPGERDLTAHVDFASLAEAGRGEGVRVLGPRGQGDWLEAMGIALRAAALAKAVPERAAAIATDRERLVSPAQMGQLFKAMALVAPGWPEPAGF
jgi:NADH dehydrogenase [ubiquinone] 1 alpha subcomplex assembly factor 7